MGISGGKGIESPWGKKGLVFYFGEELARSGKKKELYGGMGGRCLKGIFLWELKGGVLKGMLGGGG